MGRAHRHGAACTAALGPHRLASIQTQLGRNHRSGRELKREEIALGGDDDRVHVAGFDARVRERPEPRLAHPVAPRAPVAAAGEPDRGAAEHVDVTRHWYRNFL